MIVNTDEKWTYARQLTIWLPRLSDLAFALDNFAESTKANCVVRTNNKGEYAVFVKPQILDDVDAMLLAKERKEYEGTTKVVDYFSTCADELLKEAK